jgi:thioester reductase-like protein
VRTVLLTGATGFLGMEVLARLLDEPETEVVALVRASDREAAQARIDAVLDTLYESRPAAAARITALPADLSAPHLGLAARDRDALTARVSEIAHCAASISFSLPIVEALQVNAVGTSRMLELARAIAARGDLRRFVHVSTAYVAGRHDGVFAETDLDVGQSFRNTYERSKYEAELLVRETARDLPICVARPSIVVGESGSGWTPAFNVVYWPLQAFARGLLRTIPADPDGRADIVPVDYVADGILALLDRPEASGTFHLVAGDGAPTNTGLLDLACAAFDRPRPELAPHGALPGVEEAEVYLPYFDIRTRFDDRRARALLERTATVRCDVGECFGRLMAYAVDTRWGKRPLSREAAAQRYEPGVTRRAACSS